MEDLVKKLQEEKQRLVDLGVEDTSAIDSTIEGVQKMNTELEEAKKSAETPTEPEKTVDTPDEPAEVQQLRDQMDQLFVKGRIDEVVAKYPNADRAKVRDALELAKFRGEDIQDDSAYLVEKGIVSEGEVENGDGITKTDDGAAINIEYKAEDFKGKTLSQVIDGVFKGDNDKAAKFRESQPEQYERLLNDYNQATVDVPSSDG